MFEFRNAKYNQHGSIDIELNHFTYGWIPFTASPDDVDKEARQVYDWVVGECTPEPFIPAVLSTDPTDYPLLPWQFKAMVDYLDRHDDVLAAIELVENPMLRAAAKSRYLNASSYEFSDPLMQSVRDAVGMSEQELAEAWMLAKDLRSS